MAAIPYVSEEEGEDSLFQFRSPDMDMEPAHLVSGICSATKGKRSRRSRQSLSLIPKSEITARQQEQDQENQEDQDQENENQEDQDQEDQEDEEDEEEMAARCLLMLYSDGSDRQSQSLTTTSSSESLAPATLHPIRRRIKKPKRFDVGDADSPYSLEWDADFKQEMTTTTRLYSCKSCNKKFSSFQALGGHRASCHYKSKSIFPRLQIDEGFKEEAAHCSFYGPSVETYKQSLICNEVKKVRLHECPVCHRNFTSGQALGGHKRTHSTPPATTIHTSTSLSTTEQQQLSPPRRTDQTLDLNMPAEDANDSIQMQHSSAVSVNLGGDLLDSTSWSPYDHKLKSYNSSQAWWMDSHQPGHVVREDEADSQLMSNSEFVRGRDLGCKRAGLPWITTVN